MKIRRETQRFLEQRDLRRRILRDPTLHEQLERGERRMEAFHLQCRDGRVGQQPAGNLSEEAEEVGQRTVLCNFGESAAGIEPDRSRANGQHVPFDVERADDDLRGADDLADADDGRLAQGGDGRYA